VICKCVRSIGVSLAVKIKHMIHVWECILLS
jgi:hypothetical protein